MNKNKIITKQFLIDNGACFEGRMWVAQNNLIGLPLNEFLNALIKTEEKLKLKWANWLITKCMNKKEKVTYAIFAAEQVLHIYEKNRESLSPRKAIEATKAYIKNPCKKTKWAAAHAADAADAATNAADAAYAAADAAAYAADTAANADTAAYYATGAANAAANAAAYAAANADNNTINMNYIQMMNKILKFGINILNI